MHYQKSPKKIGRYTNWQNLPEEHRVSVLGCVILLLLGILSCLTFVAASDMSIGFSVTNGESSSSSSSSSSSVVTSSSLASSAGTASSSTPVASGGNSRRSEEILKALTENDVAFIAGYKHLPNCESVFRERFGLSPDDSVDLCEKDKTPLHTAPSEEVSSSSIGSGSSLSSIRNDSAVPTVQSTVPPQKLSSSPNIVGAIGSHTLSSTPTESEVALQKKTYPLFLTIVILVAIIIFSCLGAIFAVFAVRPSRHTRYITPILIYDRKSAIAKTIT